MLSITFQRHCFVFYLHHTIDGGQNTVNSMTKLVQGKSHMKNHLYLVHTSPANTPLPLQMTVAQLLAMAQDNGASLSEPCLHLVLKSHNKHSKGEWLNS